MSTARGRSKKIAVWKSINYNLMTSYTHVLGKVQDESIFFASKRAIFHVQEDQLIDKSIHSDHSMIFVFHGQSSKTGCIDGTYFKLKQQKSSFSLSTSTFFLPDWWRLYRHHQEQKTMAKASTHSHKLMCIWWDNEHVVYYILLQRNVTITAEIYS